MNEQIEAYYPIIGQAFYDVLPDFLEAWLTIEITDDFWGAEAFYTDGTATVKYLSDGLEKAEQLFRDMRKAFKETGNDPFTQATFFLDENGKFSIDFGYDDVSNFELNDERRDAWIKKYLGENAKRNLSFKSPVR